jgi:hypothetical protein
MQKLELRIVQTEQNIRNSSCLFTFNQHVRNRFRRRQIVDLVFHNVVHHTQRQKDVSETTIKLQPYFYSSKNIYCNGHM